MKRPNDGKNARQRYVEHLVTFVFRFDDRKDGDVIERLRGKDNRTDYVRRLVRNDGQ
jgi:hypothetical protein